MKLLALLFSFFLVAESQPQSEAKRILIIGDSLTAGYGVAKTAAYPAQLENLIRTKHPEKNISVVNAGSSGSTSASAASRLQWHMKKKPSLLILALGANDGLRGTPLESTEKNLGKAIDLAKENKVTIYLAGMKLPMNYGKDYRRKFEELFAKLVKEKQIKKIPFLLKGVGADPKLNLSDGIHPNEKGHKVVAQTVYEAIRGDL